MIKLMVGLLVATGTFCHPAPAAILEKIATISCGPGEADFPFPQGANTFLYQFCPTELYVMPDNHFWLRCKEQKIVYLFNHDGRFINRWTETDSVHGKLTGDICGFDSTGRWYTSPFPDFWYLRRWNMNDPRSEVIPIDINPETTHIMDYLQPEPPKTQVSRYVLRPPRIQGNYIIFRAEKRNLPALAFYFTGYFKAHVPYEYWSPRGVGASWSWHDYTTVFFLTKDGRFAQPVNEEFSYNPSDEYPVRSTYRLWQTEPDSIAQNRLMEYTFLGFGEDGCGYFYTSARSEKGTEIHLVRFDPFQKKSDHIQALLQYPEEASPELRHWTLLPDGSLIFSGIQPQVKWQYEKPHLLPHPNIAEFQVMDTTGFAAGGKVYLSPFSGGSPENKSILCHADQLQVHIWKMAFDE
ncbi:MAG: hypothetical protein C4524_08595 [Candidatus Zixiibacteriota bacterium]|nr:MAG: hypothetical protein C4524_08595 [candidate division Zixibacteria bacterium]